MAEPIPTDRARILFFVKRKEGITKEQFSNYWCYTHAKLFLSLDIVKTNILRYEQSHTDNKWFPETALMAKVPDWDGVAIIDGESFEKIFEVFSSEDFRRVVAPDAVNFYDHEKSQMLPAGVVIKIA